MKNLYWLLILTLLFISCDKGDFVDPEQDLSTNLNLKITKVNASDTKTYTINLKDYEVKTSIWHDWYNNGTVSISKGIVFNTKLPTEENLEIILWLRHTESKQLLKLDENITQIDYWDRFSYWEKYKAWDYLSYNDKVNNFYKNGEGKSFEINHTTFPFGEDATFDVINTSEVKVKGESKTRVTIKLKGDLYPFYSDHRDPKSALYRVEGEFSGIIE